MPTPRITSKRRRGRFYTPPALAKQLLARVDPACLRRVFDPAFGDGALLRAASDVARLLDKRISLTGCDIAPGPTLSMGDFPTNLISSDFFDFPAGPQFDLIVMNPPYVRHHSLSKKQKGKIRLRLGAALDLHGATDLWAYFLRRSTAFLAPGGTIAAILPWSFLAAKYAQSLRESLRTQFRQIEISCLDAEQFSDASERAILLWLKGYSPSGADATIELLDASDMDSSTSILAPAWDGHVVPTVDSEAMTRTLGSIQRIPGFAPLSNFAKVKIGVVTGANRYFIGNHAYFTSSKIAWDSGTDILTNSGEIRSLTTAGIAPNNRLLCIPARGKAPEHERFLARCRRQGVHRRSHSRRRSPWYQVPIGQTPDAFFPYRCSHTPHLSLNPNGFQSTNSIHRIYFKELSKTQARWLQLSLLSALGQLSLEACGKFYGRGIMKLEPSLLERALVFVSESPIDMAEYRRVDDFLKTSNRLAAMQFATKMVARRAGIAAELLGEVFAMLQEIRKRRHISGFASELNRKESDSRLTLANEAVAASKSGNPSHLRNPHSHGTPAIHP